MNEKQVAFLVGFFLITLFALPRSIIPSNGVINSSLIAYFPLNTNVNDYSGNSLNGTPIGISFTTDNGGKVGESATFSNSQSDGLSGINLPLSPLLTFYYSSSFTIMAWVKTTSSKTMNIFAQQKCTYGTVQVYLSNGKANFRLEDINNIDTYLTSSVSGINDGQWHNITATRDGTNHELYLFVDGIETFTHDSTKGTLTNPVTMNAIGKRFICGTTNNFIGNIDEVKIYSNELSPSFTFPKQTNSIPSSTNTGSTNEIVFIILIIGMFFVIGSILGITASNKRKRISRRQNSQSNNHSDLTVQNSSSQAIQNHNSRFNRFCTNCGFQTGVGDVFCENCGKKIV